MKNLRLGVHIIVKNEEDFLPQCLSSIQPVADEIIVVDTGSTDRTVQVAQSFGAKMIYTQWENDFSQARNLALDQANTEWILVLDADEVISEGKDQLLKLLQHTEAEAFWVRIDNLLGQRREECVSHQTVRLFRGDRGYRFCGKFHEQLIPSIVKRHPISSIHQSPVRLIHFGYLPLVFQTKSKMNRNLQMIENILADHPDDSFHTYNLGVTYCQLNEWHQAYVTFEKARRLTPADLSFRSTLIRDSAKVMMALNRAEEACTLLKEEIERYPDYSDLYYLLGESLEKQGFLTEAYQSYEKAGKAEGNVSKYVTEAGMNGFRAYYAMARIAKLQGNYPLSVQLYQQSLNDHPKYESALSGYADLLYRCGKPDEHIKEQLMQVIGPAQRDDYVLLAGVLSGVGAFSAALTILNSLESLGFEVKRLICESLMQTGQFTEACAHFHELINESSPGSIDSFLSDQALCFWSEERTLSLDFYKLLSDEHKTAYYLLERWLNREKISQQQLSDSLLLQIAGDMMERSVQLRLLRIADRLAGLSETFMLQYAKSLYKNGFRFVAADKLLDLMDQGKLDSVGMLFVAEIVYDKRYFGESASLFEQALELQPDYPQARTGAALSYLGLARDIIVQSIDRYPDHAVLHNNDLVKIENSIKLLEGTGWHTVWNSIQRRNFHAAEDDFVMHDR